MTSLVGAAHEVLEWMRDGNWRCCIIGGLAVQRWGEPRLTQDVDLTVLVDLGAEERLVDAVLARFPGRRADARAFALAYRVLLVQATNGVPLDMALGSTGFEIESVDRSTAWDVEPGCSIRTCSAEDLIVHKLIAGRPRDVADVEGIVVRQFDRLDVARIRKWVAGFAELKEDQDLGRPLEAALANARRRLSHGTAS
jgi:hypothetical protein